MAPNPPNELGGGAVLVPKPKLGAWLVVVVPKPPKVAAGAAVLVPKPKLGV